MKNLIDKIVIFILILALYIPTVNNIYMIIPILFTVVLSALLSYLDNEQFAIVTFIVFLTVSFFVPTLSFFLPLICYDVVLIKNKWIWMLAFLPLITTSSEILMFSKWPIAVFIMVSYLLKYRTVSLQTIEKDYYQLRDNTKEISMQLEKQNKELMEKQNYEINLATVTERNRIARDIHDNVGHVLSRSILQIGALLAINKDKKTKESLGFIKDTLSEAMDSIRESVHNLHEKSIDLQTEINKLIDSFKFCTIKLDYDLETNPEKNIKYCFLSVTKEALANIIKHSNASEASVIVREHPALYQLVIQDNGTQSKDTSEEGIGLKNITDRVVSIGGNVNISKDNGFRIFISAPKK